MNRQATSGSFKKGMTPWNKGISTKLLKVSCLCGNEFEEYASDIKVGNGKYCSRTCYNKYHKVWNKGKKWADMQNEKSPHWKGDSVGYSGIHMWIRKIKGAASKCESCGVDGKERKIQWSNISHEYKRDLTDWQMLCVSCHKEYDLNFLRGGNN